MTSVIHDTASANLSRMRQRLDEELRKLGGIAAVVSALEAEVHAPQGSHVVQEVVADVVGDTFIGTLAWDPDVPDVPLMRHFVRAAKQRIAHARATAKAHIPLTSMSDGPVVVPDAHTLPEERALPDTDLGVELRSRATGDADVLLLLELYEREITRKAHVMRHGMSDARYRNARRRLKRLALDVLGTVATRELQHRGDDAPPLLMKASRGIRRGVRRSSAPPGSSARRAATRLR